MDFTKKEKYNIDDLLQIMQILRSENGCPWDKVQTHESIKSNLIEETYETLEAIDNGDIDGIKEELGDVLMQVVFHTQMESEKGNFNFNDVCDTVSQKLVYRHPHVFANVKADTASEVLTNWDLLKQKEKSLKGQTQSMRSIAKGLPSLIVAKKVQEKATRVGFEIEELSSSLNDIEQLVSELKNNQNLVNSQTIGKLLFSVVSLARNNKIDAEQALTATSNSFVDIFEKVETKAKNENFSLNEKNSSELMEILKEIQS